MNDLDRHGEIMGTLGRIEQKADDCHVKLLRHETAIESNSEDISDLRDSVSKGKGVAIAVTLGATVLAAIGTAVARVKDIF